jgi:hypothetical protein
MVRGVFIGLVISAALIGPASAQRGGGRMPDGIPGGGFSAPQRVNKAELIAKELKLETKVADIESILNDAQKQYSAILNPSLNTAVQQMLNANLKGADASAMTKQVAGLEAQLTAIEADALSKVLALADAKQKTKATKIFTLMSGMFEKGDWKTRP